jgi:hypothetical protein
MKSIADKYTDDEGKREYVAALDRFRLPYWDPPMPRNLGTGRAVFGMPKILQAETVHVMLPGEGKTEIANPLHSYEFPTPDDYKNANQRKTIWDDFTNDDGSVCYLPSKEIRNNTKRIIA